MSALISLVYEAEHSSFLWRDIPVIRVHFSFLKCKNKYVHKVTVNVSQFGFNRRILCLLSPPAWIKLVEGPVQGEPRLQQGPTQGSAPEKKQTPSKKPFVASASPASNLWEKNANYEKDGGRFPETRRHVMTGRSDL